MDDVYEIIEMLCLILFCGPIFFGILFGILQGIIEGITTLVAKIKKYDNIQIELKNLKNNFQQRELELKNDFNNKLEDIQYEYMRKENNLIVKEKQLLQQKEEIETQLQKLDEYKLEIAKIVTDNTQNAPWLAQRFADYKEIYDNQREQYLRTKQHPALKSADEVREISKEKKELQKENKILKYQLDFIYNMFPFIENTIQDDVQSVKEAIEYINNNTGIKDDYEIVSSYLSPEEFQKLSNQEKYQLALDRYLNRKKKSLWEIGISYERYIGYKYEMQGYRVKYNGALKRI